MLICDILFPQNLKTSNPMNIIIKRIRKKPDTIDGHLYIDGRHICDTAENAHHCLPAGRYPIIIHKCHFRARKMPLVMIGTKEKLNARCNICKKPETVSINSTPHRGGVGGGLLYCPMLCPGNGIHHRTDAAILVGTYLAPGCLTHPRSAFDALYERIRKSSSRGHDITLEIIEDYPMPPAPLTNYQLGCQILKQF